MEWLSKPRTWNIIGVTALGLVLLHQLWVWEVERIEVPPDHFLVKINLWGDDLPKGEIVAPNENYKGIQRKILPPGRHFLNPILYTYERDASRKPHQVLVVPEGSCAVLTRKAGKEIDPEKKGRGEFLVDEPFDEFAEQDLGTRGILKKPLPPGKYYVNPYEYSVELVPAVKVEANQVGVQVLLWGDDPSTLKNRKSPYVVPKGYRGVQEDPLSPATYYVNPYVEKIIPVDVRSHPVEFKDIYFPSRDGFTIQPHVLVAYKVVPEMAPELYVMLCDKGQLYQKDDTEEDQNKNPILQKFILPLIRGYVRIEGSKYDASKYVSQQRGEKDVGSFNPRELMQKELMDKVAPACQKVGVIIEEITVTQPEMNPDLKQLADQISERERTRVTREKNKQLVEQHKAEQEQKAKGALAEQRKKVVEASTKLEKEKINAMRLKEVEKLRLEAELKAAEARLEGARKRAEATVTEGKAEAAVITARNEAEVAGLKTAIGGFVSPEQFAQYHVLMRLSPALSEIFASDTSEFAKMFSSYMTPGDRKVGPPTPVNGGTTTSKK